MKKLSSYKSYLFCFIFFLTLSQIFGSVVERNGYKLDLNENSGRFKLYKRNPTGEFISVLSDSDSRTTTFSIYENNGFYALGDSFRFKKRFTEKENGGEFIWTSKELFVVQTFTLDDKGFLEISFSITNISTRSKSVGMKLVLDTEFEKEDYFYVHDDNISLEINQEYEIVNPDNGLFWTSGARNSKGSAIMSIPSETLPTRIVWGNWDLLDDADYYFKSVPGRVFNNPPYSINDSAVMFLYSPKDILPQNSRKITYLFRAISSVEKLDQLVFEKRQVEIPETVVKPDVVVIKKPEPTAIPEKESAIIPEVDIEEPVPVVDTTPVPEVEELNEIENEPEIIENKVKIGIDEQLETISKIQDIISTISLSGLNIEVELLELEKLIKNLEEININEN
jgi:hypothetical protein